MKRSIAFALAICILFVMFVSCSRGSDPQEETMPQMQTNTFETTSESQTEPEPITQAPETTTEESTTETAAPAEPEKLPAYLEPFYNKLRSERWIEITDDQKNTLCVEFFEDGGMKVFSEYNADDRNDGSDEHAWEETFTAQQRHARNNRITYVETGLYAFEDMDYDDCIHLILDGAITYHRVMVRESAYSQSKHMERLLRNTRWQSDCFKQWGIDKVSMDDFDVIPINETTAHLVYHDVIDSHTVQVTVKKTNNLRKLDAFLIRTYAEEGYCPETSWHPETWTRV